MEFKRSVVVTGVSSGIGKALCTHLLSQGHKVIGLARHPEIFENQKNYYSYPIDLIQCDLIEPTLKKIIKEHDDVDTLVSNAGAGVFGCLEQLSSTQITQAMHLNLLSHILVTRHLMATIKKQEKGDVIFMGSEAALRGAQRGTLYCSAKFGLRGFAQSLRQECASSSVRVTIINPGMVRTAFFDDLDFKPGDENENAIEVDDIVQVINLILKTSHRSVFDEINISPLKKVVSKKEKN